MGAAAAAVAADSANGPTAKGPAAGLRRDTICRAHEHAAGARKQGAVEPGRTPADGLATEPDDQAIGRLRGGLTTKLHLAVDASFHVLATVITAGQRVDAPLFAKGMERIRVPRVGGGRPRVRPDHVLADRAYSSRRTSADTTSSAGQVS